jgi:Tfp pilus assembly protein PilX
MGVRALHAQREAEAALSQAQAEFQADAARQQAAASQVNATANGHRTDDGPEAPPN